MNIDFDFKKIKNVRSLELIDSVSNPNFAVSLGRTTILTDEARLAAIEEAKTQLEYQRFINAVDSANRYPTITQIHMF